jgi:hypothetical protein
MSDIVFNALYAKTRRMLDDIAAFLEDMALREDKQATHWIRARLWSIIQEYDPEWARQWEDEYAEQVVEEEEEGCQGEE